MFDIVGLMAGIATTIVGSSVAIYTVIKNSHNKEEDGQTDEVEQTDEVGQTDEVKQTDEVEQTEVLIGISEPIKKTLVKSAGKNTVHHTNCRFVKQIKDKIYLDLAEASNLKGCSYCKSKETLKNYENIQNSMKDLKFSPDTQDKIMETLKNKVLGGYNG